MSQGSFTDKWIHSSQDRLPGSFMNENHHTMTHVMNGEEDRNRQQQRASTNKSQQGYQNQTSPKQQQQTGQNSQLEDDTFLSQEPKRSVVGTQQDDFQKQQSSWIDENSDNYSRAKDQFPSAGNSINQQQPTSVGGMYQDASGGGTTMGQQQGMDYDPNHDPATRSAFQSVPQPVPVSINKTEATGPPSVPDSLDSNRAIMNQPLVSGQHDEDDDIQPATSADMMPSAYQEEQHGTTADPTSATQQQQQQNVQGHGFNPDAATTAAPTAAFAGGAAAATSRGPLDASGIHNQQASNTSTPGSRPSQSSMSPPLGRGKYKKRNSTPDHEYAAALPVLQSYVPYAQGVAVRTNNETRYEDRRQQQAATNRRYSLHGADELHHGFSPVNDPNATNTQTQTAPAPAPAPASRRRSSLAESITKIFRRNSGTK